VSLPRRHTPRRFGVALVVVAVGVLLAAVVLWRFSRPADERAQARRRFAELQRQVTAALATKADRTTARGQVLRLRAQARTGDPSQRARFDADAARLEARLDWGDPTTVRAVVLGRPLLSRDDRDPAAADPVAGGADAPGEAAASSGCRACHMAIDREGFETYPQPFRTHPNLSAYVGGSSPHPSTRVSCTACHQGQERAVTYAGAGHSPGGATPRPGVPNGSASDTSNVMLPVGQTQAGCATCHVGERRVPGADALTAAFDTYDRGGCWACHAGAGFDDEHRRGPDLRRIRGKLTPAWVQSWLRNPRAIKPATWMPRFWGAGSTGAPTAEADDVEIAAVTAYLFAASEPYSVAPAPRRGDAGRGEQVVRSVGCLGCHIAGDDPRDLTSPRRTFGQPLQAVGQKTSAAWLHDWVRNPARFSPSTRMPNLRLTDAEAADVVAYLASLDSAGPADPPASPPLVPDAALRELARQRRDGLPPPLAGSANLDALGGTGLQAELGRLVIARRGCFNCHDVRGFEDVPRTAVELRPRAWAASDVQSLHGQPGVGALTAPQYALGETEQARLALALTALTRPVAEPGARPAAAGRDVRVGGRTLVQRRNCVGCHAVEGTGGDFVQLVAEPSLGPPLLTPEGARVQPAWLRDFLRGPITIRPWLAVRMPTFGLADPEIDALSAYFRVIAAPNPAPQSADAAAPPAVGQELFELLKCQQCHVLGAIPKDQPTSNLAPDLRMAHERLQPEWIVAWLRDPSAILPGTRMPSFWPDYPKSFYPPLDRDGARQVRAIRDHLLTLRGGPSPSRGR
jgi:mono/diheme cytochrome c family protein